MPKKAAREDVHVMFFAAKLSLIVVGAFVFALGSDVYDAVRAIERIYGS
jgi:hypothetical protein